MLARGQKNVRSPILVQVEEQGKRQNCLGRARNISLSGVLMETPDTLAKGAGVIIRFFVPPDRSPIETAGRVVKSDPGSSMTIAFLGLPESQKEKLLAYLKTVDSTGFPEPVPATDDDEPRQRRSGRLVRRVSVLLNWQDPEGRPRQQAAETLRLSRYGAVVLSFSELPPGQLIRVSVPDTGREGSARVVWNAPAELPGRVELGLEFLGAENFWEMAFPSGQPDAPKSASRRSGRLPCRMDVSVCWSDELGRAREEAGQTRLLSRHGALLTSLVPLEVGQGLQFRVPDLGREVESRVVWARPGEVPGRTDLGVEFIGTDNFWNINFPPPEPAQRPA